MNKRTIILPIICLLVLAGCSSRSDIAAFDARLSAGDYAGAESIAAAKLSADGCSGNDDVLWNLEAGSAGRFAGDYSRSTERFDDAETAMKRLDEEKNDIANTAGAVLANDNVMPYYALNCEGVMMNVYKALNAMARGDEASARIEFNRALDRQRRTKEFFSEELNKARANAKNAANGVNPENPSYMQSLYQRYPELVNYKPYGDYVNPFVSYIAALFFAQQGDSDKAEFLFKEALGTAGENPYLQSDFENFRAGESYTHHTWVFFENGLAPYKEEFKLELPLLLSASSLRYYGIALPKLTSRPAPYSRLTVHCGSERFGTEPLCSMERVIKSEFAKGYAAVLIRAIASASVKVAMQSAASEQSDLAGVLIMLYSAATTTADCRSWTALPKEFQVLRLDAPQDGNLLFMPETVFQKWVTVPADKNSIVYVKAAGRDAAPVCEVIELE